MPPMKRNSHAVIQRIKALKRQWAAKGLPCHLCGNPIRYDAPRTDPLSCQADHREPVANGGHVLGQMLPAHAYCNQSRQAKSVEDFQATRNIRIDDDGKPTEIPKVKRPMKW